MASYDDVAIPVPFLASTKWADIASSQPTLIVQGEVLENAERFEVNLLEGATEHWPNSNTLFHISVRFDEGVIVFNTAKAGNWDEREQRVGNCFTRGHPFDLRNEIKGDVIEVIINNVHVHTFHTRLPISSLEYTTVKGDISLKAAYWSGVTYGSEISTALQGGCLRFGQKVYLFGKPTGNKFAVNLESPRREILFHFNPRKDENEVVRNACLSGDWGNEEREGGFPFSSDAEFAIAIHNEPSVLKVFVNGLLFCTFVHRTDHPEMDYNYFHVEGDIHINGCSYTV